MNGEESWRWLAELKGNEQRRHLPVIVATDVNDPGKGLALGADSYFVKPLSREALIEALLAATAGADSGGTYGTIKEA